MILLELCGTPGCGKSYLIDILCRRLEEKGIPARVAEGTAARRSLPFVQRKLLGARQKLRLALSPRIKAERTALREYIAANGVEGYSMSFYTTLFTEALAVKSGKEQEGVFIPAEGMVQALTSLSHGRKMGEESLAMISAVDGGVYAARPSLLVFCDLSVETNIDRLEGRGKKGDRFLLDSREATAAALELKKENLRFVFDSVTHPRKLTVSLEDADAAAESIMKNIEDIQRIIEKVESLEICQ